MPKVTVNGIGIHYETTGKPENKPYLLISGVGTQLTRYSQAFTDQLADAGFYVIRMDNRDIGLSDGFETAGLPDFHAILATRAAGGTPDLPYTLDDMADDCAALIDHLGLGPAHVAGSSMGGMIAQLLALRHPDKLASMTSIMSTTGHPDLPRATPKAQAALTQKRSDPVVAREANLDESVAISALIGSPAYPEDPADMRAHAAAGLDRAYRPTGFARQYAAILAAPHRRDRLAELDMPVLVIHGSDDPLVRVEGGRDTAAAIKGAEMLEIAGMGHNIPAPLYGQIVQALARNAGRAG